MIDMTGKRFGRLVVLEKASKKASNGSIYWKCKCDCGSIKEVIGTNLRNGHTQSCGCLQKEASAIKNAKDLIGQHFGRLTVIEKTNKRTNNGSIYWLCECDCGKTTKVSTTDLLNQSIQSCGCLNHDYLVSQFKDIAGQRFGKLVVIEKTNRRLNNCVVWKCKCDCGNEKEVDSHSLISHKVGSCGCLKSKGELKIQQLLKENNIKYIQQKSFDSCRFPDTNALAYFDFYVNDKYLIEFDGEQHFTFSKTGWNTKERFEYTQNHDNYKNQWCKENNIHLIRIPYTRLEELTIEDLLLD